MITKEKIKLFWICIKNPLAKKSRNRVILNKRNKKVILKISVNLKVTNIPKENSPFILSGN